MKKQEIFDKLKKEGILTDAFKFSYVEFIKGASDDIPLLGYYESYGSSLCDYSAYLYVYLADKELNNIKKLPYSEDSSSGYAHSIPIQEEVAESDIAIEIQNTDFEIEYIILVSKDASCQQHPYYSASVIKDVDNVIEEWKRSANKELNEEF